MERKISVERLYSLGQYQNVKFIDEITNIPESIALNREAMNLIAYSQILQAEKAYYNYFRLRMDTLPKGKLEDVIVDTIEAVEEEQSKTWEQLLNIIMDKKEAKKAIEDE